MPEKLLQVSQFDKLERLGRCQVSQPSSEQRGHLAGLPAIASRLPALYSISHCWHRIDGTIQLSGSFAQAPLLYENLVSQVIVNACIKRMQGYGSASNIESIVEVVTSSLHLDQCAPNWVQLGLYSERLFIRDFSRSRLFKREL